MPRWAHKNAALSSATNSSAPHTSWCRTGSSCPDRGASCTRTNVRYADIGIRRIMPTSGLCRAAGHGSRNPGHSGEATRHNQRDSRTASSVSSGRFRPGLEASLPTECTRFGAVTCRTIYEWPLPLWQGFDPVKPGRDKDRFEEGRANDPPFPDR
jgi:hypothetical protein